MRVRGDLSVRTPSCGGFGTDVQQSLSLPALGNPARGLGIVLVGCLVRIDAEVLGLFGRFVVLLDVGRLERLAPVGWNLKVLDVQARRDGLWLDPVTFLG